MKYGFDVESPSRRAWQPVERLLRALAYINFRFVRCPPICQDSEASSLVSH